MKVRAIKLSGNGVLLHYKRILRVFGSILSFTIMCLRVVCYWELPRVPTNLTTVCGPQIAL
jgi:hypothetical protein